VKQAIEKSGAKVVYVVNLMTKKEETNNYKASDFVEEILGYLSSKDSLTHVIVNSKLNGTKKDVSAWYERYGSRPVKDDLGKTNPFKIVRGDFMDKTTFYRHDPEKISRAIMKLF
jgi:2-phospho-L-lactate transferase/gluconeogenesis factor (CofD/UPF0052 family)